MCVVGRKETATGVVNSVVVDVVAELSCVCVCVVYVCLHITWLRSFEKEGYTKARAGEIGVRKRQAENILYGVCKKRRHVL